MFVLFLSILVVIRITQEAIDEWSNKLKNKCYCYESIFKSSPDEIQKIITSYLSLDQNFSCLPASVDIFTDKDFIKIINNTLNEDVEFYQQTEIDIIRMGSLALYRLYYLFGYNQAKSYALVKYLVKNTDQSHAMRFNYYMLLNFIVNNHSIACEFSDDLLNHSYRYFWTSNSLPEVQSILMTNLEDFIDYEESEKENYSSMNNSTTIECFKSYSNCQYSFITQEMLLYYNYYLNYESFEKMKLENLWQFQFHHLKKSTFHNNSISLNYYYLK